MIGTLTTLWSLFQRPKLGETVREQLRRLYSYHKVYNYNDARKDMYNSADCHNNEMYLVYGGNTYDWKCGGSTLPSATIINAEHTIPQSFFGKRYPMVSDIHHIFAAPSKLNNVRSNYPFVQMDYSQCAEFCKDYSCSTDIPSNPDDYSCLGKDSNSWMPIKSGRGQVARAIFYFFTMYDDVQMDQVGDINTFKQWNKDFPPTDIEKARNDAINKTQGNRNPYIDDFTLVDKAFP